MVVISDMHCGQIYGLTPPSWQLEAEHEVYKDAMEYSYKSWIWYKNALEKLKPIDILIVNGDAIDGRGELNGGRELITTDRFKQSKIAIEVIEEADAGNILMVKGTPYHVGKQENYEEYIAEAVGADELRNHLRVSVNGCVIDARHKVGRSSIPHGKFTPTARQLMWDSLKRDSGSAQSNILIRSHVHYFTMLAFSQNHLAITTPALQGITEYGVRECEGNVDFGLVYFDINENGQFFNSWSPVMTQIDTEYKLPEY